ncbi:MAG TPA: DNA topoisomerase, partial [Candidatus Hodarchaeales archaeon]|nr:DNA topoisomerase [Candidatus Hodarchaeales archaeon]
MRSLFQTPLIVAEKPSIARGIVRALSIAYGMKFKTEKGKSRYNRIFRAYIPHEQIINLIDSENNSIKTLKVAQGAEVSVSSVSGHLTSYDYPAPYDKDTDWSKTDPLDLVKVDAKEKPISQPLYDHVIELGARTDLLVIATDWDNQGESIGGQIARVVTQGLTSPPEVTRMRFTSTTVGALQGAFESQHSLDHLLIESVDSLRRQDLRMGASLTRHLTTGVQQQGRGIKRLVSYGPCQSSVLWIVANRYFERQRFVPLAFWRVFASVEQPIPQDAKTTRKAKAAPKTTDLDIKKSAKARKGKKSAIKTNNDFLFEWIKSPVSILSEATQIVGRLGSPAEATVFKREVTNQNIDRPKPLDTDTLESDCARLFGVSPKLISDIAEKLYNNGLITYPRTESSYYLLKDFSPTCEKFLQHEIYSSIADFCTKSGNAKNPSKGRFTKDHEPIIPVKAATEKEVAEALKGTDFENSIGWR